MPKCEPQPIFSAATGGRPGQTLVALAPGAAFGHAKRWPPDRFAKMSSLLRHELGAIPVVIGQTQDREGLERMDGVDLVGQTDLLMLMGVLSHCHALVGNDSGALHLAAALGVPVTAIYGPTDERYSPPLSSFESFGKRVQAISRDVFCRPCG